MINILIVEDEVPISNLVKMSLEKSGYTCHCVYDGLKAAELLESQTFDLILLDIMLPKIDGYELMSYISSINIPVIFMTAKVSVNDRVKGLKMGAEDYIVKPFSVEELNARVEGVLRRHGKLKTIIEIEDIVIDTHSMQAYKNGVLLPLTKKEYLLLVMFARNAGLILSKITLYENIWGGELPEGSRTVELHIQRLRKKLGWGNDKIKMIYSVGWRLEVTNYK